MFPFLAEELERMIWEKYLSRFVFQEIKEKSSIWFNPSDRLLEITKGWGTLQICHSDFERVLLHKTNEKSFRSLHYHWCLMRKCRRCLEDGFPCWYAVNDGGMPEKLIYNWDITFYKGHYFQN